MCTLDLLGVKYVCSYRVITVAGCALVFGMHIVCAAGVFKVWQLLIPKGYGTG